jgi:hypothetical protein
MKVIGQSAQGYLIAASESDIARLFGGTDKEFEAVKLDHLNPGYGMRRSSLIGLEINVDNAYAQLAWLRRRNAEFTDLIQKLRMTATAIEDSRPLFTAVTGDGAMS